MQVLGSLQQPGMNTNIFDQHNEHLDEKEVNCKIMNLTQEQQTAFDAYTNKTSKNIIVLAVAGCGKTTWLVKASNKAPQGSLFLAFNKSIAESLGARILADCKTINSAGFGVCRANYRGYCKVAIDKYKWLLSDAIKERKLNVSKINFIILQEAIDACRINLTTVDKVLPYEFSEYYPLVNAVLDQGKEQCFRIDFIDQLWHPIVHNYKFPYVTDLFVDECQDLNRLQHEFISRFNADRHIFVGDPCQAIYGFAGASAESFYELEKQFNCDRFLFTRCFRTPDLLLNEARKFVSSIHSEGLEGNIYFADSPNIPQWDEYTKLFRWNAPLIKEFLGLSRTKQSQVALRCTLNVIKEIAIMSKKNPDIMQFHETKKALQETDNLRVLELLYPEAINSGISDYWQFLEYCRDFGKGSEGPIILSTIHRAKGLEWDNVILDEYHTPAKPGTKMRFNEDDEIEEEKIIPGSDQEMNLYYVAVTRAKVNLVLPVQSKEVVD